MRIEILKLDLRVAAVRPAAGSDWTRITQPTDNNTDEVAMARTPDGVLHIAWVRKQGDVSDYMHTAISPTGKVIGNPSPIVTGWNTLVNPALVVAPNSELWLFFGGIRTTDDHRDPYARGSLYAVRGDAGGAHWSLLPGARSESRNVYEGDTAAALAPNGMPVIAWAQHNGLGLQFGFEHKNRDSELELPCCIYHPWLGVDGVSNQVVAGWHSNADGAEGLFTETVSPNQRELQHVPDSSTDNRTGSIAIEQHMAITGRLGDSGVYVAYCIGYPSCTAVNLWRYGSGRPITIAHTPNAHHVNISQAPDGRLWIMWANDTTLFFTRSNRAATRLGEVQTVVSPKGTQTVFKLDGDGKLGPLDVMTHVQNYPSAEIATWYTRVLPPLTFTAQEEGQKIVFLVTDVDDPVSGATVNVQGKTLTTDSIGRAILDLPAGTHAASAATASKEGYRVANLGHSEQTGGRRGPKRFM
jgi:hypothetical protein